MDIHSSPPTAHRPIPNAQRNGGLRVPFRFSSCCDWPRAMSHDITRNDNISYPTVATVSTYLHIATYVAFRTERRSSFLVSKSSFIIRQKSGTWIGFSRCATGKRNNPGPQNHKNQEDSIGSSDSNGFVRFSIDSTFGRAIGRY